MEKELSEMTVEELVQEHNELCQLCDDYYFNQHYIEKYRDDEVFINTGTRVSERLTKINDELRHRIELLRELIGEEE